MEISSAMRPGLHSPQPDPAHKGFGQNNQLKLRIEHQADPFHRAQGLHHLIETRFE
jgi:hypothetical protein